MREEQVRAVLREVCDDLDRRQRRGLAVLLGPVLGVAIAISATACVNAPTAPAADARVDRRALLDGRADVPPAVAVYSAPGCSFDPRRR